MMNYRDQSTQKAKLVSALNPDSVLVDGRDVRDRLGFVAKFAELILFYNQQNQQSGNWQGFLVKDVAILLAVISKTDYSRLSDEYQRLSGKLINNRQLKSSNTKPLSVDPDFDELNKPITPLIVAPYAVPINQLFDLIWQMLTQINAWIDAMSLSEVSYDLKAFVYKKVRDTYGSLKWQVLALQQYLATVSRGNAPLHQVKPADKDLYQQFSDVWPLEANTSSVERWLCPVKESGSHQEEPAMEGGKSSASQTLGVLIWFLKDFFEQLFSFYSQVIEEAKTAFYQQIDRPSDYPDTALLRAFSQLMDSQQGLINRYSREHLMFYYRQILQLTPAKASADEVIVCLTLAEHIRDYELVAGTEFIAGSYPDKSDIVFVSKDATEINHAQITRADSWYYLTNDEAEILPHSHPGLYFTQTNKPNRVQTNQEKETISWDAFGNELGSKVTQGFALASPILLLEGGEREIRVTLDFTREVSPEYLNACQCYLSTEKSWFKVSAIPPASMSHTDISGVSSLGVTIRLTSADPKISAFSKKPNGQSLNPDGYDSEWPIFKLLVDDKVDLVKVPQLTNVTIKCVVTDSSAFVLGNTQAPLPNKGAASLLGPVPELSDYFYLASSECFSKPLSSLTVTIDWDNLPKDFSQYYQSYNSYLTSSSNQTDQQKKMLQAMLALDDCLIGLIHQLESVRSLQGDLTAAIKVLQQAEPDVESAKKSITSAEKNAETLESQAKPLLKLINSVDAQLKNLKGQGAEFERVYQLTKPKIDELDNQLSAQSLKLLLKDLKQVKLSHGPIETIYQTIKNSLLGQQQDKQKNELKQLIEMAIKALNGLLLLVTNLAKSLICVELYLVELLSQLQLIIGQFHNNSFQGQWSLLADNVWHSVSENSLDAQDADLQSAKAEKAVNLFQQEGQMNRASSRFSFDCEIGGVLNSAKPSNNLGPLPGLAKAHNGYLKFELTAPKYAFGHSLYGKLVSAISLENAAVLITKGGGNHKLDTAFNQVADPFINKIQPMPNEPYSPKASKVVLSYSASITESISIKPSSTDNDPLEIYHYGSYQAYRVYDNGQGAHNLGLLNLVPVEADNSLNLVPLEQPEQDDKQAIGEQNTSIPLLSGVSGSGCLYLALTQISAPCSISLFIEIDPSELTLEEASVGYFYWAAKGWQPLTVLENQTNNLNCSGIIKFELPLLTEAELRSVHALDSKLTYIPSPIMPKVDDKHAFWIAITTKQDKVRVKFVYLNTQAVTLKRADVSQVPTGSLPSIAPLAISATKKKVAQLAGITQPFASFNGVAAEDESEYLWRVSQRIHNKDRVSSANNYERMTHSADNQIFYAKSLPRSTGGKLGLGLVNRISDPRQANAYRPIVSACRRSAITAYIEARISAMARVDVFNLKQQQVTIKAEIIIRPGAAVNALLAKINQALKLYLSPWIYSETPQASITLGVERSGLIDLLTRSSQVTGISSLDVYRTPLGDGTHSLVAIDGEVIPPESKDAILVSAMQHMLSVKTTKATASSSQGAKTALYDRRLDG